MIKKFLTIVLGLVIFNEICCAKDILQFDFPNEGWHKVKSPDGIESKKCFVPVNQTTENYTEMLIFYERIIKHAGYSPMSLLQKQLGKDKNNYKDIVPEYILTDEYNPMVTWCSKLRNTCAVERAIQGKEGIVIATYLNKAPHYSQNIFGQWSNILALVKIYDKNSNVVPKNLIELD